jgi:heterodisulfide reductase subunit C
MIDFGYTLQKDRQIDFDANDMAVVNKVIELEPSFRICIACGTCAATCSAGQFTSLSLRRIIIDLKRGVYSGIADELMKCMLCGKCQLACPRGVNTRRLLLAIRKSLNENAQEPVLNIKPSGGAHEDL